MLFSKIADRLTNHIHSGAYVFRKFPGEEDLAREYDVSRTTLRRALKRLIDDNLLVRKENGRLEVAQPEAAAEGVNKLALLIPSYGSPLFAHWRAMLASIQDDGGAPPRQVSYQHWDDPLLWDALQGFSGSFLLPVAEPMAPMLLERMRALPRPPVILGEDFSAQGLPSVIPHPPVWVQKVLDHLAERGHRRIACVNVQPVDIDIEARIGQWRLWMAAHRLEGPLVNEPTASYDSPFEQGVRVMRTRLDGDSGGVLDGATAVFCTTLPAAVGVYRAIYERGWKPGRELAVATLDGEDMAAALAPSLTAMARPDMTPQLRVCLDWIKSRGPWCGPLAMRPEHPELRVRESSSSPAGAAARAAASGRWSPKKEPAPAESAR